MGTLTLRPGARSIVLARARQRAGVNGDDYDALSPDKRYALMHAVIGRDLTLMMKRMRLSSDCLRFIIIAEAHKDGWPHYHVLVHEPDPFHRVTWAQLAVVWKLGFSKWKLVTDHKGAVYASKYLGKDMLARVRASVRYGQVLNDLKS